MVFNYGIYHSNKCNKVIHCVGIPIIVFCLGNMLTHLLHTQMMMDFIDSTPLPEGPFTPLNIDKYNLAAIILFWVPLTTIYVISDFFVGLVWVMWTVP